MYKYRKPNKYVVQHDFFEKPNIINSYIAGFIAADGNISKKSAYLKIELHEKDYQHLINISSLMTDRPVNLVTRVRNNRVDKTVVASLSSSKIIYDLKENFNLGPCKTFLLKPPLNLTIENSLSFIIGSIDGDGTIGIYNSGSKNSLYIRFLGTFEYLDWVKHILGKFVNTNNLKINKVSSIFYFQLSGCKALDIYLSLKKIEVPKLERKWHNSKLFVVQGVNNA